MSTSTVMDAGINTGIHTGINTGINAGIPAAHTPDSAQSAFRALMYGKHLWLQRDSCAELPHQMKVVLRGEIHKPVKHHETPGQLR
jgi:hypothetical protein